MNLPFPTDLSQFIVWLGQASAVGVIVSFGLERLAAFQRLSPSAKSMLVLALAVGLPFASLGLQNINADFWAAAQPYVNTALGGLVAWAASQYAHDKDPRVARPDL